MSLGASAGPGARLAAVGLALGLAAALVATRLLGSLLHGVTATDPATFAAVAVAVFGIAMLATLIPARRATGIAPVMNSRQWVEPLPYGDPERLVRVREVTPDGKCFTAVPDVRATLKAFDPALPSDEFTTLEQVVDRAGAPRMFITTILGAFSSLALMGIVCGFIPRSRH